MSKAKKMHTWRWTAAILPVIVAPAHAQLVGVECCVIEGYLQRIGLCASGPEADEMPLECVPAVACFGEFEDDASSAKLCLDAPDGDGEVSARSFCSSWRVDGTNVARRCALSEVAIDLFALCDDDRDGDLDLRDVAVFQNTFPLVPNAQQPQANPFVAECCVDEGALLGLGGCLGGPGAQFPGSGCDGEVSCVIGFAEPVGPGDELFQLCRAGEPQLPTSGRETCVVMEDVPFTPVFRCQAAPLPGISTFVMYDWDLDGDLDLADYSAFLASPAAAP